MSKKKRFTSFWLFIAVTMMKLGSIALICSLSISAYAHNNILG